MAEGRMLKRAISKSKKLPLLKSDSHRLLYTWMIPFTDIDGRYYAETDIVKGDVVPRLKDWDGDKIAIALIDMVSTGLIEIYKDDELFLHYLNHNKHQKLRKDHEGVTQFNLKQGQKPLNIVELQEYYSTYPLQVSKEVNIKKVKVNIRKGDQKPTESFPFLENKDFEEAYQSYLSARKKKKHPINPRIEKRILINCHKEDIIIATEMLDRAAGGGWQKLYALKPENPVLRNFNAKKAEKVQKKKLDKFKSSEPLSDDEMIAEYKKSKMPMPARLRARSKELEQMLG